MSKNYDNWEKLVGAVLRRELLRHLALCNSRDSSCLTSPSSSFNLGSDDHFLLSNPGDYSLPTHYQVSWASPYLLINHGFFAFMSFNPLAVVTQCFDVLFHFIYLFIFCVCFQYFNIGEMVFILGTLQSDWEGDDAELEFPFPQSTSSAISKVNRVSPILWHANRGDAVAVRKLLEEDPTLVQTRDYDYRTPLHMAAIHGRIDLAKCLLEFGADVNTQDRWKNTVSFYRDSHLCNS